MASVEFEDFRIQVEAALDDTALRVLEEGAIEIENAVRRNSRKDTGQLKGSWAHLVDENKMEATIGSPLENAIWEEFGTGEYAVNGDGRKGGWLYEDKNGETVFTRGKKPNHALQRAFDSNKGKIINHAKQVFKEKMS